MILVIHQTMKRAYELYEIPDNKVTKKNMRDLEKCSTFVYQDVYLQFHSLDKIVDVEENMEGLFKLLFHGKWTEYKVDKQTTIPKKIFILNEIVMGFESPEDEDEGDL